MPIWKALEASYSKDCAGAFDTETWVEARFYHDLGFNPLPESFQEIQNNLQQQRKMQMPSFGDDSGCGCWYVSVVSFLPSTNCRGFTQRQTQQQQRQWLRGHLAVTRVT